MGRIYDEILEAAVNIQPAPPRELDRNISELVLSNSRDLYEVLLNNIEPTFYRELMHKAKYNQSKAAKLAGISRSTLRTKLKKYSL